MDFYEILQDIMEEKKLTIPEIARRSGLPDSTIRSMISRKNKSIALEVAFKLSKGLNVSLERLNGEKSESSLIANDNDYDFFAEGFWQKYERISKHDQEIINTILEISYAEYEKTVIKKQKKKCVTIKESIIEPTSRCLPKGIILLEDYREEDKCDNTVSMPIYDIGASAGTGVLLDSHYYEVAAMPDTPMTRKANFAVWVSGHSMEPKFNDGDLVLVRTQPAIDIGEIGIFIVNGDSFIKKQGEDRLISLNPDYDDIIINEWDEVYCKGKVLDKL